jgi:3-dehydroquinate synthase
MIRELFKIESSRITEVILGREPLFKELQPLKGPLVFIVDEKLSKNLKLQEAAVLEVEGGEQIKTRETKSFLEDELIKLGVAGDAVIVGIGGGALLDLVGFVAATYCRGVRFISVPTTLLAMVDAAIGGKNGVNVGASKNFIGAIHHPEKIIIQLNFFQSLPVNEIRNGLSEMVKHAFISGDLQSIEKNIAHILEKDFDILQESILQNIQIKMKIVQDQNPEKRHLLNLGHTAAHALEVLENFSIPHGLAVAIGLIAEAKLARRLKILPDKICEHMQQLVRKIGFSLFISKPFSYDAWKKALQLEKKSKNGKPRFVFLQDFGKPFIQYGNYCHEVEESDLQFLYDLIHKEFIAT